MSTMEPNTSIDEAVKRAQRNLRRREQRAGQSVNQLRLDCKAALQDAKVEVEEIRDQARKDAALLNDQIRADFFTEFGALDCQVRALNAQVEELQREKSELESRLRQRANREKSRQECRLRRGASTEKAQEETRNSRKTYREKRRSLDDSQPDPNRCPRSQKEVVTKMVSHFEDLTKFHNLASKKKVMERFWTHSALKSFHPTSLGCPKADLSWRRANVDVKKVLSIVKYARRKDHKAAKDILLASFSGREIVSNRYQSTLAKALCIKRAPVFAASKKRALLDGDESLKYPLGQRKERSDRLSEEIRGDCVWFWEAFTRPSPNKKDLVRKRIARKEHTEHRVHWLEDTEAEYFFKFQEWLKKENKGYTIGLRSFQALKPFFIRTLKDRDVCCCKQHVEMQLLCKAFAKQRQTDHPLGCECRCVVCAPVQVPDPNVSPPTEIACVAHKYSLLSVREWCAKTLCPKGNDDLWHKRDCLVGVCEDCGPGLIDLCPWEERTDNEESVQWDTYEYVFLDDLPKPRGKRRQNQQDDQPKKRPKRLRLVSKVTSMAVFRQKIYDIVETFIKHDFYARWQVDQYQNCLKYFPRGTIVSSIDFAENYTFATQDEVQSLHWDNRQITILVLITYRHQYQCETDEPIVFDKQGKRITRFIEADYHFFISDDNSHDLFFVQHSLNFHWEWMKQQGFSVSKHIMWSDGCAAQFKGCRPFSYVAKYYHDYGAPLMWCFHASGHEKGVQDGLGGGVKQAIRKEQLRKEGGHAMEGAHDVVEFLKKRFCLGKQVEYDKKQGVRRFFWEVGIREVERSKGTECLPVKGVRRKHCFLGYSKENPMILKLRELACFCYECILDGESEKCENKSHVVPWEVDHVYPKQRNKVAGIILDMHDGLDIQDVDHEGYLGDLVSVGDYFAALAKEGNECKAEFYILLCTKKAHRVEESFTDGYGAEFVKGDRVLAGTWFQQYGKSPTCFVRNEKAAISYVDVASVIHMQFGLVPTKILRGSPGFKLPTQTLEAILCSTHKANPPLGEINLYG